MAAEEAAHCCDIHEYRSGSGCPCALIAEGRNSPIRALWFYVPARCLPVEFTLRSLARNSRRSAFCQRQNAHPSPWAVRELGPICAASRALDHWLTGSACLLLAQLAQLAQRAPALSSASLRRSARAQRCVPYRAGCRSSRPSRTSSTVAPSDNHRDHRVHWDSDHANTWGLFRSSRRPDRDAG